LFLGIFFLIKIVFSVSAIEVVGTKKIKGLSALSGKLIFFIFSSYSQRLYENNPTIKSVRLIKILPNKIRIEAEEYNPVACFAVDNGFFFLAVDGRILEKGRQAKAGLPIIHYYQKFYFDEYRAGDKLKFKDLLQSLYLADKLRYLGINIEVIDISGLDMLIFNSGDKKYFFTTDKDKELLYQEFKTIIERFKIEKTEYESIDLRFDKPIIKLK